jgi:AcrR family transcriptional regulator
MDVQPSKRRLRERSDTRQTILDANEALLVEEGYDRFSMRKLAGRCGCTAPTIYHHFGDKQGLIDALLEERFGKLFKRLRRVPLAEDPVQNLQELAQAFVRFAVRHPIHYRLLHAPRPPSSSPIPSAERTWALFDQAFRELAQQGRLLIDDVEGAAQACWATLHGVVSLRASLPDYAWSPDLLEVAMNTLIRGLIYTRSPGPRRARA